MKTININTVIDVGAHLGEFSEQIYRILPNAKFYCFEPIRNNFIELTSNLNSENFKVFNIAVGDHQGNIEIYANNFSPSSSVLKLSDFHKAAFPFAANEQLEQIEINTLDAIFSNIELKENILLKIDVQGYEDRVIKGAKNLLERIKVIIVETSFRELYEGQVLFIDIYEILHQQGFVYSGSVGDLKNPVDGIPLQQDSLFIKQ